MIKCRTWKEQPFNTYKYYSKCLKKEIKPRERQGVAPVGAGEGERVVDVEKKKRKEKSKPTLDLCFVRCTMSSNIGNEMSDKLDGRRRAAWADLEPFSETTDHLPDLDPRATLLDSANLPDHCFLKYEV